MKHQRLPWFLILLAFSLVTCSTAQPALPAQLVQPNIAAKPTDLPTPTKAQTPVPTQAKTPKPSATSIAKPVPQKTPVRTPVPNSAALIFSDITFGGFPPPGDSVAGGIQVAGALLDNDGKPVKDNDAVVINQPFAIVVAARIPGKAAKNGDGVATVDFRIEKPNGKQYTHTEKSVNYCSFGDVGPVCNLQPLDDNWPDGTYSVNVAINPIDSNAIVVNWNFTFIIKRG